MEALPIGNEDGDSSSSLGRRQPECRLQMYSECLTATALGDIYTGTGIGREGSRRGGDACKARVRRQKSDACARVSPWRRMQCKRVALAAALALVTGGAHRACPRAGLPRAPSYYGQRDKERAATIHPGPSRAEPPRRPREPISGPALHPCSCSPHPPFRRSFSASVSWLDTTALAAAMGVGFPSTLFLWRFRTVPASLRQQRDMEHGWLCMYLLDRYT